MVGASQPDTLRAWWVPRGEATVLLNDIAGSRRENAQALLRGFPGPQSLTGEAHPGQSLHGSLWHWQLSQAFHPHTRSLMYITLHDPLKQSFSFPDLDEEET